MSHHMYFSDKKTCPLCRDNIIISDVVLDKLDSNNISYVFTKIIMNNKSLMYCSSNTKYLGIKRKCRNKAFPENNGCCRIHHTFNIDISFFKLIFTIFIFHYPIQEYSNINRRHNLFSLLMSICRTHNMRTIKEFESMLEQHNINKMKTLDEIKTALC